MDRSIQPVQQPVEGQIVESPAHATAPELVQPLSHLAKALVTNFEKPESLVHGKRMAVNPVVVKFASWYEKLRNVMEYREEEVMLRAAIERILKRRLLLGGNAKTTAEPLVRELIWAR